MSTVNVNANLAQCIVTKAHWGYDTVINICTGATRNIEWAMVDYLGAVGIGLIGLILAVPFAMMVALLLDTL